MAAGTSIFTLLGEIFIDNEKANESIQKTESRAEKMAKGLGGGIKTAAKWGAAITGAAVGVGAAMFGMAKKSADALDEIHKGSSRMGVTTDAFQEMEYWGSQNGIAMNDVEKAVGRLNQRMGEAANGNEKYSNALEKLGVNMDDVRAGTVSTEDAFAISIQSLSEMESSQERAAAASELFGTKLARELLPALEDGSLSFEDAKERAAELGIVLSEDSVNAGATFTDTMDDVKRSMGAVVTNIGAEVMPIFQQGLEWVLEHMPEIQEVIKVVFEKIGEFITAAANIFKDYLLPIFQSVFDWTKENWPIIQKIIEGVFKAIKLVWENVLQPVLTLLWDIFKNIVKWVSDNWPTISKIFKTVFDAISTVWNGVLKPVLDFLWELLKNIFNWVSGTFSGITKIFETAFEGIGKAVETVTGIFEGFIGVIKRAWDWLTKWNNTPAKKKDTSVSQDAGYSQVRRPLRGGLDYVPYDNYKADLHKGERVLTAEENKEYDGKGKTINHTGTIKIEGYNNKNEFDEVVEIVIDELRREVRLA